MIDYLMQSDSDYLEKVEKAASTYNLMSILMIVIFVGVIVALICSFYFVGKSGNKPMRKIKTFDKYKTAMGKITMIEEETFFIEPYVKQAKVEYMFTGDDKKKKKNSMLTELEKYAVEKESDAPPKPIEKKRYKVIYTFAAEGLGDGYVYEKKDSIKEEKKIEVQYDPERPQVNFTEYSRPI